jgi:hypothetical protein
LEFDWSKAVPIEHLICRKCGYHLYGLRETRCPECGESFTWEEVLDDHHRRQKPTFEYRWRDRPFRSFVYTWWLTLRPWKLWRTVDLHDPVRVRPLFVLLIVAGLAFWIGGAIPSFVVEVVDHVRLSRRLGGRGIPFPGLTASLPEYLRFSLGHYALRGLGGTVATWGVLTFAALLVFQPSLRRCKVRTTHVFRVCAFALIGIAPIAAFVVFAVETLFRVFGIYARGVDFTVVAFFLVVAYGVCSVALAYRRYLRMPHSIGVVIASQIMALLATGIALAWSLSFGPGFLQGLFEWWGW